MSLLQIFGMGEVVRVLLVGEGSSEKLEDLGDPWKESQVLGSAVALAASTLGP